MYKSKLVIYVLLLATLPAFSARRSILYDRQALIQDVSLGVQTPCIPWAKPLYGGPLKVLFIGPMYGQRETAEVAQRLDLNFDVQFTGQIDKLEQSGSLQHYSQPKNILADLKRKLEAPLDSIVIGNFDWKLLSSDIEYKVFEQVSNGAGLVYVMYSQNFPKELEKILDETSTPDFLQTVPYEYLLSLRDKNGDLVIKSVPEVKNYTFGKGRICLIRYPLCETKGVHYLTPDPYHQLAYEYCQSYLIKNILWSSGKKTLFKIRNIEIAPHYSALEINNEFIKVNYKNTIKKNNDCILNWSIRSANFEILAQGTIDLPKSGSDVVINVPFLPAGRHTIDFIAKKNNEVLDWASKVINVSSPYSIPDIELLLDSVDLKDKLSGHVLINQLPKGGIVRIKLLDSYGRLYNQTELPEKKYAKELYKFFSTKLLWFNLSVSKSLSNVNKIRAELILNDRLISFYEREFYVSQPLEDEFLVGFWGNTERLQRCSHIQDMLWRRQRNIGADLELVGHVYRNPENRVKSSQAMAREGIKAYPYVLRVGSFGTERVRKPCLTDPVYLNDTFKQLGAWASEFKKYSLFGYNLGDENNLSARGIDVCISQSCLNGYYKYLKNEYIDIESLNKEWNTKFTNWEQLNDYLPPTKREASSTANMAPWIDHRLYMTNVMMGFMKACSKAIKNEDNNAICGPEGIWGSSPYFAFDWQQLCDNFEIVFPYYNEPVAFNAARSLSNSKTWTGIWAGGYPPRSINESMARFDPWMALFNDMKTIWFYSSYDGNHLMTQWNAISPDFRLNRCGNWFFEETNRIQKGIGKFIRYSKRDNSKIALLFSKTSSYLVGSKFANNLIYVLQDAGYQFDLITPEVLNSNLKKKFKCIIIPGCVAMSDIEIKYLRSYVESGGVLVCDIPPATYTEHGRFLSTSKMAEVFGFVDNKVPDVASDINISDETPEIAEIDVTDIVEKQKDKAFRKIEGHRIGSEKFCSNVLVKNINGKPVVGINKYGNGHAVCLNLNFDGYDDSRQFGKENDLVKIVRDTLISLDIEPLINVVYDNTRNFIQGVQAIKYEFNGGYLLCLLRNELSGLNSSSIEAEIILDNTGFVYHYGTGRFLGQTTSILTEVKAGPPEIYFILDRKLDPFYVKHPEKVKIGGKIVLDISMPNCSLNVFRIEFMNPKGKIVKCYSKNYVLKNENLNFSIYLALNEIPGSWRILTTDVLTGQKETTELIVN